MARKLQNQSNRENAQKSTGPKTAAGKRRASQNALQHGLSCATPDVALCLRFYEYIIVAIDGTETSSAEPFYHKEAMDLAHCEAHLLKVNNKLIDLEYEVSGHLARISERGLISEHQEALAQVIATIGLPADIARQPDHWIFKKIQFGGAISLLEPLRLAFRERRLLLRYRAEAEAARSKALNLWLEADERDKFDWKVREGIDATLKTV